MTHATSEALPNLNAARANPPGSPIVVRRHARNLGDPAYRWILTGLAVLLPLLLLAVGSQLAISAAPAYTMAAAIANEFSEATTQMYLSALFAVGLVLFIITITINALARLLVWRVARGAAVGSKAL